MSIPREGSRDDADGIYVSKYPDVCRSPTVPVPYTIVAFEADDANTVPSVRMTGKRSHNMGSLVTKCTGDEPGTGLGVKSGTVGSVCHPKEHSATVRIAGKPAVRDGDEVWMNNKNTVGKRVRTGSNETFEPTPPIEWDEAGRPQTEGPQVMTDALPEAFDEWQEGKQYAKARTTTRGRNPTGFGAYSRHQYNEAFPRIRRPPGRRKPKAPPKPPVGVEPDSFFDSPYVRFQPGDPYTGRPPRYFIPPGMPSYMPGPIEQVPREGAPRFGEDIYFRRPGSDTLISASELEEDWENGRHTVPRTKRYPDSGRTPNNVKVTGRGRDECKLKIGVYKQNCGTDQNGEKIQDHHIYADFIFRTGGREGTPAYKNYSGERLSQGGKRVTGAPNLMGAPSACLEVGPHKDVHESIRKKMQDLPPIAPLDKAMDASRDALIERYPECEARIKTATATIDASVRNKGHMGRARESGGSFTKFRKPLEKIWGYK